MFAANATFQIGTYCPAFFCCHANQLSDPFLIEHLEWIKFQNFLFQINRQEGSDIVA